jgi:hypothetical protein
LWYQKQLIKFAYPTVYDFPVDLCEKKQRREMTDSHILAC